MMAPLIFGVILLVIFSSSLGATFPIAKPGCDDHCGNVSIPFPFGTREGCYLDDSFNISCRNSSDDGTIFDPPQPFLGNSIGSTKLRVTHIFPEGQLRILQDIGYDCYDKNVSTGNYRSELYLWHFNLNSTGNKFTLVGCDATSFVVGQLDGPRLQVLYVTGCNAICYGKEYVEDGSCSGIGCCQTSIPSGARSIIITVGSLYNHSYVGDFINPCSFGFLVETDAFQFYAANFTNLQSVKSLPILVDWIVAYENCSVAQKNSSSYACGGQNSVCSDDEGALGYRCKCKEGHEGNPYLSNGCRDIDECASNSTHNCPINSMCTNTLGSYTCNCIQGYHLKTNITGRNGILDRFCQPSDKKNYWPVIAGVASVAGVLFFVAVIFAFFRLIKKWQKKKQREKFFKRNGGLLLQRQLSSNEKLVHKTKIFSAKELNKASDGFNPNRVLGEGGQGTVYKGMLTDGTIVAIKKSKRVDEDQLQQFINEVVILSQVIHKNVVNLLGCCLETEVPLLVYEFVPNGTLYSLIHHGDDEVEPLTWSTRLRIAREVASALAYLHSSISTPIFHKDIKSLNILMDEKFRAKVSDFGTSRSVELNKTHLTTRVQGTFGYIDPEFFQSNQFTDKSDVYSFGVVLIELLTRQKPISARKGEDDSDLGLVRRFLEYMEKDGLKMVLDPEIIEERTEEEVVTVAGLAARCVHLKGRRRPSMKEVVTELENIKKPKLDSELQPRHSPSLSYYEEDNSDMSTFTSGNTQSESHSFPLLYDTV